MTESSRPLPFGTRIWFAYLCFFKVLFDGLFAARVWDAREPKALPPPEDKPAKKRPGDSLPGVGQSGPISITTKRASAGDVQTTARETPSAKATASMPPETPALQLLSLLQREGRLVDFLEQDVATFTDADVGAAARVVHEGCRKALKAHVTIEAVRAEEEGSALELPAQFDAREVKLTGNVQGSGPYKGKLVHRGWRAKDLKLPTLVAGHDASILAPAEVEL